MLANECLVVCLAGRTKTTQILKRALAPDFDSRVINLCRSSPFALMCDGGGDRGVDNKDFVILVRMYDPAVREVRTRFMDMPVCNHATAVNLFDTISASFR